MSTSEIPKNAPASTPKSPSDTLLKNFQSTLEKRWTEFDSATMKEAQFQVSKHPLGWFTDAQTERAKDANFIKAKAAFDQARSSLSAISDDTGLKQILNSPGNLLSAIETLEAHFALATAPEKAKEYNHVLANTLADLTSLRSQVTETAEDKKAAEVAAIAVKTMPAVAVAAVAIWWAESLLSGADAKWLLSEGSKEIKTSIKSAIAEALGFDKKTMIDDMSKRAKWESIGFMGTIRVMIFALLNKISFLGITDDWSPEEMKMAGLGGKVEEGKIEAPKEANKKWEEAKIEAQKLLSAESYELTTKLLIYGASREKFQTALGGALWAIKDATWGLDDIKKKEAVMSIAIVIIGYDKVKTKSWAEIQSLWQTGLLTYIGKSEPQDRAAVDLIFRMLNIQSDRLSRVFVWEDWTKIPLGKLMATLYTREWYDKIESLTEGMKNIDISKAWQIPTDIFTKITKNADGISKINWIVDYESLKNQGITTSFVLQILTFKNWERSIAAFQNDMKNSNFSQQEKSFLDKILSENNFLVPLRSSLENRFGFTPELMQYMKADTLSVKDTLEIYAITGWEWDISKLNKGRKALLFTRLQVLFGAQDANALWTYLNKLATDGADKYPEAIEVGNMVDTALNYGVYKATFATVAGWEKLLDGLLWLWWINVDSRTLKAIAGWWGLAAIVYMAIKLTPVGRIVSIVSMLLAALRIGTITAVQAAGKK